jgi:hypothetical protein
MLGLFAMFCGAYAIATVLEEYWENYTAFLKEQFKYAYSKSSPV